MTRALWMPGIEHRDLTGRRGGAGNYTPGWQPKGCVLHVNDSAKGSKGTSIEWYAAGGGNDQVCPTWQVYPDGSGTQLLPMNRQPWTQRDGNGWGPSIETGGNHAEPLTPAAVATCGRIMAWLHAEWDIPLQVTDTPARGGLGTHQMGGAAWGGHPCPGTIRAHQRDDILAAARGADDAPTDLLEEIMALDRNSADYKAFMADVQHHAGVGVLQATQANEKGHQAFIQDHIQDTHNTQRTDVLPLLQRIAKKLGA